MSKNKEFIINRNKYKDIKSMDHSQMNEYINGIRKIEYEKGYKLGRVDGYETATRENAIKSTKKTDFEKLKQKILEIKGIGEVKANSILEVLKNEE